MPTTRTTSASGSESWDAAARPRGAWRLLRRDQTLLYLLCLGFLGVVALRYTCGAWTARRAVRRLEPADGIGYRVDINRAGVAELSLLPKIGPKLAARIVAHREANGPFQSTDDLAKVRGVSRRMVAAMHDLITLGPASSREGSPQ